jgi:hypothetical protein
MRLNRLVAHTAVAGTVAVVGAFALSACAAHATPAANNGTTPATAAATPATTPPATKPSPVAPVTTAYDAARAEWKAGSTAISADQGNFWSNAVADLTSGETTDTNPTGYANAVAMLKELIALPDGQQTPAQNAAYHNDINGLNAFFKTPGLYS